MKVEAESIRDLASVLGEISRKAKEIAKEDAREIAEEIVREYIDKEMIKEVARRPLPFDDLVELVIQKFYEDIDEAVHYEADARCTYISDCWIVAYALSDDYVSWYDNISPSDLWKGYDALDKLICAVAYEIWRDLIWEAIREIVKEKILEFRKKKLTF